MKDLTVWFVSCGYVMVKHYTTWRYV